LVGHPRTCFFVVDVSNNCGMVEENVEQGKYESQLYGFSHFACFLGGME
jgi:hypothetical protein